MAIPSNFLLAELKRLRRRWRCRASGKQPYYGQSRENILIERMACMCFEDCANELDAVIRAANTKQQEESNGKA